MSSFLMLVQDENENDNAPIFSQQSYQALSLLSSFPLAPHSLFLWLNHP